MEAPTEPDAIQAVHIAEFRQNIYLNLASHGFRVA
jgi:hypothetical protein